MDLDVGSSESRLIVIPLNESQSLPASLTLRAVLSPPALHAVAAALLVADEVAVGVVAGAAEGGAGVAVVEAVTDHAVGVQQLRLVLRLGPLRPHAEGAAGRCAAQEGFWTETCLL